MTRKKDNRAAKEQLKLARKALKAYEGGLFGNGVLDADWDIEDARVEWPPKPAPASPADPRAQRTGRA